MSRTHDAFLPGPDVGPPLQEVSHYKYIGDDALIVPECEATNRGEKCTSECVLVAQQPGNSRWAVAIGVSVRILGGRSRIRSSGGKVQVSTIRNRPDAVVSLRYWVATRIFGAERSVVFCAGTVAHGCKAEGENGKSRLFRDWT